MIKYGFVQSGKMYIVVLVQHYSGNLKSYKTRISYGLLYSCRLYLAVVSRW